jgi:Heavy-metal resistance
MKRPWLIILGGLILAGVAYATIYLHAVCVQRSVEQSSRPELAWLKKEYELTDPQFARVMELHNAYTPKCREMCRLIDEKNARLQQLLAATNAITPEITQALAEAAQVRVECQSAMLEHFYEISRAMPPEQGKRYLAWVQRETLMAGTNASHEPISKDDKPMKNLSKDLL